MWNVCGELLIDNPSVINWLGSKLSIRCYRFNDYFKKAKENGFTENRGKSGLSNKTKQEIYNMWINHSINSTDSPNGRNQVRMNKESYIKRYGTNLKNDQVVAEKLNRRKKSKLWQTS